MRSNTHDVTLSSFICVFFADAWSLQWFHFSSNGFPFVRCSLLLLYIQVSFLLSFFLCRCMATVCVCEHAKFAGHLFFFAVLFTHTLALCNVHSYRLCARLENIPYYINIFWQLSNFQSSVWQMEFETKCHGNMCKYFRAFPPKQKNIDDMKKTKMHDDTRKAAPRLEIKSKGERKIKLLFLKKQISARLLIVCSILNW